MGSGLSEVQQREDSLLKNEDREEISRSFNGSTEKEVDILITTQRRRAQRQAKVDHTGGEPGYPNQNKIHLFKRKSGHTGPEDTDACATKENSTTMKHLD